MASRTTASTGAPGRIVITSSGRSWYEGMSTRRPLMDQCRECPGHLRAWRREAAKPSLTSTLSKRDSSSLRRFSPVTPSWRLALS